MIIINIILFYATLLLHDFPLKKNTKKKKHWIVTHIVILTALLILIV